MIKWSLICMVLLVIFISMWLNIDEKISEGFSLFILLGTITSLAGSIIFMVLS